MSSVQVHHDLSKCVYPLNSKVQNREQNLQWKGNIAERKMGCHVWWRQAVVPYKIIPLTHQFWLEPVLLYSPQILFHRVYSCKGHSFRFQRNVSVTLVDNFQPCAAHSNSLLIPHILLTVNGMQNSIQPCSADRSTGTSLLCISYQVWVSFCTSLSAFPGMK